MKLSLKFFLTIFGIAIIPLLIVGFFAYSNIKQIITQNIFNKLEAISQIQKDRLESEINNENDLLNLFTEKKQLRADLNSFDNNPTPELRKNINDNISESIKTSNIIKNILIVNPSGTVVSSTESDLIGENISAENYFKQGMKQNDISFIGKNKATGEIERYLVGPLSLNNKTIGVAVLVSDMSDINLLVNDYTGLGQTGETLLAKSDGNGNALFLAPTRFDKNAALTLTVSEKSKSVPAVHAILGEEKTFSDAIDYRNVPVFAATRYIKSVGWGIVAKIDQSEALQPLEKIKNLFLFVLLSFIILIIIVAILTSFYINRPIKELVASAKKIIGGDLSQNLQIKSKDEIGDLSHFLNQMLDGLKKITEKYKDLNLNLEKEIKVKTSRLENQNVFLSQTNKAMANLAEDLEKEKNKLEVEKINNEAVITGIGDALIAIDDKGIITTINPVAEKMFGYKYDEIIGKSVFETIPLENEKGKFLPKNERPLFLTFSDKKTVNATYNCVRKDKSKFIASITSSPIILNGEIIGAVDVFRDVTMEKAIDKAKTEFVSLASHQLRTPISAIKWYSEMLMEKKTGKLNVKQSRYLGEIYHGNERMIKLINNLLNIARIEMGKMEVKPELINAKSLLEEIIKEQEPEISKKKHAVTVKQIGEIPEIYTDRFMLRMILQNFVSNAVKYTVKSGKIICTIKKEGSDIVFGVKDSGIGIPEKEQKRIFEKLFRASNAMEYDKEGNGLGLYTAKEMAKSLGGKVRFESNPGEGTTFYFKSPLKVKV